ncbi:MAG: tripartite tricarboxylate transporter substrate binding protein [Betaproteobacteria bacterium]|nr:tripartite tricarboxylate transporter substrate binding protein [Betaproteobacteria bacterium]
MIRLQVSENWRTAFCVLALALCQLPVPSHAQGFPGRPIRLVMPFPPGGASEGVARPIVQKAGAALGQQFVLDSRPGASGVIAAEIVAKAPPDGYTLLLATSALFSILPGLSTNLPFDPVKSYAPITRFVLLNNVLVVHPSLPVKNVNALIALAKRKPGQLNYASAGNGTTFHLAGEMFKSMAKIDILHVPYKGGAPAQVDLIAGQVQVMFDSLSTALTPIRSGRVKVLAVTTKQRSPVLPDIPTVAESGLPDFEVSGWFGVVAPANTPRDIVTRLNAEIVRALGAPEVRERLLGLGHVIAGNSPGEFAAFISSELAKYSKVIKDNRIRAD